MKKVATLFFLFIFLIILSSVKYNKKVLSVFNEENNDYNLYKINIEDTNLNTNQFSKFFSRYNVSIVGIYLNYNLLYKDKLTNFEYYKFTDNNINKNINRFLENIENYLDEMGNINYLNNIRTNGVNISKVTIYCTENEIDKILKANNLIYVE